MDSIMSQMNSVLQLFPVRGGKYASTFQIPSIYKSRENRFIDDLCASIIDMYYILVTQINSHTLDCD